MTGQTRTSGSAERLRRRLERDLLSGRIPPGTRLPSERQLASAHGISRPVVRELLRSLVERRLIDVTPGRGTFARRPRPLDAAAPLESLYRSGEATALDVVQARVMLERQTAALAAQRATPEDLATLAEALARFQGRHDVVSRARADIRFHAAIAHAAHNVVVETMFASITAPTFELMLRSLSDPEVERSGAPLHDDILAAIEQRDPTRAQEAMTDHLVVAYRLYGDDLDRSLDQVARREVHRLLGPAATLEGLLDAVLGEEP
jgi:GntR family transcriptional repressor for pyruvate dehydrogenase complex